MSEDRTHDLTPQSTGVLSLFPELDKDLQALSYTTGTLPSQDIEALIQSGNILAGAPIVDEQIQPSSLDLRLGPVAYRVQAGYLPGERSTVEAKLQKVLMSEIDITRPALFERNSVYIVPLLEELRLSRDISAKANPRSTTGRLDVFTRLITDYGTEFERVPHGYKGKLYAEVLPRTFGVILQEGMSLNQLRFVRGSPLPADAHLTRLSEGGTLVYSQEGSPVEPRIAKGLRISIKLSSNGASGIIGYKAKNVAPAIDFGQSSFYDPEDFWDPVYPGKQKSIVLNPGDFYIFGSQERVSVPPDAAAEMVPYDPAMGEFRIHYAGFFDPGFGYGGSEVKGATAVLEVRSHGVPFLIEDGQVVGRLIYERLLAVPRKIYGTAAGSSYQYQGLLLSRQFKR